jgi:signal transduction histidine kinase
MRERALLIGADLAIESRPDHGTTVRLTVPGESSS